ncbi:type II secretion system GspH family protein [Synechococcus sp. AH-551-E02]|nr:type II secretion system GspH family protein [Synechococcus sp. AH-551-E02]
MVTRVIFNSKGFTLIELVVVMAGLAVLTSLTVPNVMKIFDFNNIDEAKAILNSAAADCIQKTSLQDAKARDTVDPSIVSDKRVNTIGYTIDSTAKNCSYFQLNPSDSNDILRYPIGFSVDVDGKLNKFANPTSSDGGSINSCEKWAGVNCKQDESLKELIAHKKTIAAAEQTCRDRYSAWLSSGTNPSKYQRWNTNADSGCPSRPPSDGSTAYKTSNTCTANGCNKTVYGLDGKFVGFEEANYDAALEEKYGKICTEKTKARRDSSYTNPSSTPITIKECGTKQFWFYNGEDAGSQIAWEKLYHKTNNPTGPQTLSDGSKLYLCLGEEKATEALMKQCISNNEEAECDQLANERAAESKAGKNHGKFVAKPGGSGRCSDVYWYCDGENVKTETAFNASSCAKKDCGSPPFAFCDIAGGPFWTNPSCINWARCMGHVP